MILSEAAQAVTATEPDFVLIGPDGFGYETLFNRFRVRDNPSWR